MPVKAGRVGVPSRERWVGRSAGARAEVRGQSPLPLAGEARPFARRGRSSRRVEAALKEAGTSVTQGVWLNQFVTSREHVDPYHEVRRDFIRPPRPASTTVAQPELLAPDATCRSTWS